MSAGEKSGIGEAAARAIRAGMTNAEALSAVMAEFPGARTTLRDISWYRSKLRSDGGDIPSNSDAENARCNETRSERGAGSERRSGDSSAAARKAGWTENGPAASSAPAITAEQGGGRRDFGNAPIIDDENDEQDSGIERDAEDGIERRIEHPFNPERIKISTKQIVIEQLVARIRHKEIDLAPEFQRLRGIWKRDRKSRLIESLLLRIPLPVFYVGADKYDNWAVVDGLQRMSTIYDYVNNDYALVNMEYLDKLNGKRYDDLPRALQRRIGETQIGVNVIEPGTPGEVMFNIFHRINTGGMKLNGQEIRHALNPGPVREFLRSLADSDEFRAATDGGISKTRMADRDCVLRFLAFHMTPWEDYSANDVDGYMGNAMKEINSMSSSERDSIAGDFKKSMRAARDIFGNDAFRKRYRPEDMRNQVNRALFGAWSVGLARRSAEDIERLVQNREAVRRRFTELLNSDTEFDGAISYSTGTPRRVRKQFQAVDNLIEECLGDA